MTSIASLLTLAGLFALALRLGWWLHAQMERQARAALSAEWEAEKVQLQSELAKLSMQLATETAVARDREAGLNDQLDAAHAIAQAKQEAPNQVAEVMAPVQVALAKLEEAMARSQHKQSASTAQIEEQIKSLLTCTTTTNEGLRRETARLVSALSRSEVRGQWGELQLRRLLDGSGLVRGQHYTEQVSVSAEESKLRPDVIVHLGNGKDVVVDSKVSLTAILAGPSDETAAAIEAMRRAHAKEIRGHVDRLADKEYGKQFDTAPEAVIMFLPAESLLSEALIADPALLEHAFSRRVVLAMPTTFMLTLRTVSHIWRQEDLAANARVVQQLGRELAERMRTMLAHLEKVGRALDSGVKAYNQTVGSLESRVMPSTRRFTDLQGLPEIQSPKQVDQTPRTLVAVPAVAAGDPRDGEGELQIQAKAV